MAATKNSVEKPSTNEPEQAVTKEIEQPEEMIVNDHEQAEEVINEPEKNIQLVKFISPYKCYSAGDVTGFASEISEKLIAKKLAVAYQE